MLIIKKSTSFEKSIRLVVPICIIETFLAENGFLILISQSNCSFNFKLYFMFVFTHASPKNQKYQLRTNKSLYPKINTFCLRATEYFLAANEILYLI
jgi:hypothetical protein